MGPYASSNHPAITRQLFIEPLRLHELSNIAISFASPRTSCTPGTICSGLNDVLGKKKPMPPAYSPPTRQP